jgi:hypothetical protein
MTNVLLLLFELVQLGFCVALLLIGLGIARQRAAGATAEQPSLDEVRTKLQEPLNALLGGLEAEHQRVRALTDQAGTLVASLQASQQAAARRIRPPAAVAAPPSPETARDQARRLLAAGGGLDEVARATDLPASEVRVLANLAKARDGALATLKNGTG